VSRRGRRRAKGASAARSGKAPGGPEGVGDEQREPSAGTAKQRAPKPAKLTAPTSDYTDTHGNVLTLRGSLTPATRREYAAVLSGAGGPAVTREDAWHRAVEFLFERLAVRWAIAGAPPIKRQRELLARLRASTSEERAWVREALREHCKEHFPELRAP
jgi:hypothetical protein